VIISAPKNTISIATIPEQTANKNAPLNTLKAFLKSPFATLADTSFETAIGRL